MGVPGLTTFIEKRADLYMEKCKLHDTSLVIDGIAVAFQIYKQCYPDMHRNMCFGGDYDLYADGIKTFFNALSKCNITPYVVFDGGYEAKKIITTIKRLKERIRTAEKMSTVYIQAQDLLPIFTMKTFMDIAAQLNVKMVQCDFEADTETANLAHNLGCPVLSFDSDFYIFGGLYIPIKRFSMTVKQAININKKSTYNYLDCELYNAERFIQYHHLEDKSTLPLLAVLLGNDYVKKGMFSLFRQNQDSNEWYNNQSQITDVLLWLRNKTRDSTIRSILGQYSKGRKKAIFESINNAIKGYYCFDSIYLKYFGIPSPETKSEQEFLYFEKFCDTDGNSPEPEDEILDYEGVCDPEMIFSDDNSGSTQCSSIFLDNFRKCLYPSCFMDMFLRHKYYIYQQVEDVLLDNAHVVSFEIIGALFKILTGFSSGLLCIGRVGRELGKISIPAYHDSLPTLEDIQNMDNTDKQKIFFKILKVDNTFKYYLNLFPNSWHIYILAIKYAIDRSKLSLPLICSLVLSKIIISCIDYKIGFFRCINTLMAKHSAKLNQLVKAELELKPTRYVSECLNDISTLDSIHFMIILLKYFKMTPELASSDRFFDRRLVHCISEFQSILLHLKYLNDILQRPYPDFLVSDCLNCTFVYNFTNILTEQGNIDNYLESSFSKSPSVLRAVKSAISAIKEFGPENFEMQNNANKVEDDNDTVLDDSADQLSVLPVVDDWEQLEDLNLI